MKTRSSFTKAPRGFALVITMSLMVLLLVLAVGLLSLSAVTLRTSSLTDPQRVAQANARLGLMLAIGELQKAAGKDQRITGTADLAGTATGERISDGAAPGNNNSVNGVSKGLSGVQAGTRHWTGVWENPILSSSTGNPGVEIYTKTPSARLVQWLVSGNENGAPKFLPDTPGISVGSDGQASDSKKAVVLVGENTVGDPSGNTLAGYVVAPLVKIASQTSPGGYAWWVGDEGVKSRLNSSAPFQSGDVATSESMSAQRRGWETVDGFGSYPLPGSDKALSGILTMRQAELVGTAWSSGRPSALNKVFHAATADSMGVLSDSLHGGLRLDLTTLLSSLPSAPVAGVAFSPQKGTGIIPSVTDMKAPTLGAKWDRLAEFSQLRQKVAGGVLEVQKLPSGNILGPVISDFRLVLGATIEPASTGMFSVNPLAKIAITLANPYPYTLRWPSPLQLKISHADTRSYPASRIWNIPGTPYITGLSGEVSVLSNTTFEISSGSLPPGEAVCYTIGGKITKVTSAAKVTLVPATAANLLNLDAAVVLRNSTPKAPPFDMDVREGNNTSPINVELFLGTSTLLRKLHRVELDSALFSSVAKKVQVVVNAPDLAKTGAASILSKPFPLQTFSMQLSQPGFPEKTNFDDPGNFGIRSSTMRTFTDFNLQAAEFRKPIICYNPPPYFMTIAPKSNYTNLPPNGSSTATGYGTPSDFSVNLLTPRWGRTPKADGSKKTVLFSFPQTLTSIAQFQHADLTGDDLTASVAHQPGNAVGNSYASPFIRREVVRMNRADYKIENESSALSASTGYYDTSYLLNASLWDAYFFSTVQSGGKLLNKQLIDLNPTGNSSVLTDSKSAASRLMVEGAFNINSTEKEAWKALLASSKYLSHPTDGSRSSSAYFPRGLDQPEAFVTPPSGEYDDSFSGYRRLSDDELDILAQEITKQVRRRGPFLSLAQFVNRALTPIINNKELSRSGALQSAIDNSVVGNSAINITPDGSKSAFSGIKSAEELDSDRLSLHSSSSTAGAADFTGDRDSGLSDTIWPKKSSEQNPGSVASILADKEMMTDATYRSEQGSRSSGIPGWLTQADVLQVIGPALTARSDTFRIRAYGEATDSKGKVIAKAWCEAMLQRTPSYVDPNNADTARDTPTNKELNATNQKLGRQIKMISFRWLSPYEI